MELYIKNMVCNRCIAAVHNELLKLDLHPIDVQMGIVKLEEEKLDKARYKLQQLVDLLQKRIKGYQRFVKEIDI